MAPFIDLTGQRFGRLTVLRKTDKRGSCGGVIWQCQCDCGNAAALVTSAKLRSGHTQSCGCLALERLLEYGTKHGMCNTQAYRAWRHMLDRCENPNCEEYCNYGERGVGVSEDWHVFANFHADVGDPPEGMTLDRYPNRNGNYEKGNCRWATPQQQAVNTDRVQDAVGVDQLPSGRFRASIQRHRQRYHIGVYDTEVEAISVRKVAKEKLDGSAVMRVKC
jgi:hypothetical protein